ncbi:MAG: hypothetical protein ACJ79K_17430 [Gemmatimonadaceae bacterium]
MIASAFVLGLTAVLFRLMDGSWSQVARTAGSALVILALYAAPVGGIAVVFHRRGQTVKRWWFLALLPVWGALAGAGVGLVDPGPAGVRSPIIHGIVYGVPHALYLRWAWRREARRARPAAA